MADEHGESVFKDEGILDVKKWDRFSEWIHCICVVTFDLEFGQALESVHPQHIKLTDQEKSNICYLAFPDSNSGCMGDTQFHIRLRSRTQNLSKSHKTYNNACSNTLQADSTHFWGFVYFRQVRDISLPRGYFQKSVVILTRLPFINLMYKVCGIIAPRFFDDGEKNLIAACHDIDRWPKISPGSNAKLPLLGNVFHCFVPSATESSAQSPTCPQGSIPASLKDVHSYRSLSSVMTHLHLLWELVLTAEPIVVMAASPTACCSMVQALVDLIQPLEYFADYRPYFTIHDSEFKEFTKKQYNPPNVILGVTNPFFAKTLHHWPHTVRLNESASFKSKLKKVGTAKSTELPSGVYTQYKPFLSKDKTILKRLSVSSRSERPAEVQAALVRRHLLELTQSFMIPLERYMASLMPLQKNISAFRAAPAPKPFNPDDFMTMLQQAGPHLTTGIKGDWAGLYRAFIKTPNFSGWFQKRYAELSRTLQALQLEALASSDLSVWANGKEEVEIVDMVLKLKKTVRISDDVQLPLKGNTRSLLRERLEDITRVLPDDLKSILQSDFT